MKKKNKDKTPQEPSNIFRYQSSWENLFVLMDDPVWIVHPNIFPDEWGEFLHLPREPFLFSCGFVPLSAGGQERVEVEMRLRIALGGHHWPKKGLVLVTPPESQGHRLRQELGIHWKVCVLHREGNFSPSSMSVIDVLMKNSGVSF